MLTKVIFEREEASAFLTVDDMSRILQLSRTTTYISLLVKCAGMIGNAYFMVSVLIDHRTLEFCNRCIVLTLVDMKPRCHLVVL